MQQYKDLLKKVLEEGNKREDRTGTGTISVFGHQSRYNLQEGFPLLTLKKTHFKSIVGELLWFLSGSTSAKELREKYGVTIWDEWQREDGELGPIYSHQWVNWGGTSHYSFALQKVNHDPGINQIQQVINKLKTNPLDRGIIVNAWNVSDLDKMALRPCHTMFQFYTTKLTIEERSALYHKRKPGVLEDKILTEPIFVVDNTPEYKLSLQLYQRSADILLGVPFNIASYALLLEMIAQVTNMVPFEFIHTLGDAHIYNNHIDAAHECLTREEFTLPTLNLNESIKNVFDFTVTDISLDNYQYHPVIKLPVAI